MDMHRLSWLVVLLLVAGSSELAGAAEPPSDLCSLLPSATVSKTLGQTYGSPKKSVAPRPFPNTNQGTDCTYESGGHDLLFRAYIDPSPSASAELFAKLKTYFGSGSTPASGIGDEAYFDKLHGLHVRKGKVRYFVDGAGTPKQKTDLAIGIAGQL